MYNCNCDWDFLVLCNCNLLKILPNHVLNYTRTYNLFWVKPLRRHWSSVNSFSDLYKQTQALLLSPQGSHAVLKKYWISKWVFKTLKKCWILPNSTLGIEKVWKFKMEKKSEVSEQNFTEGKALHYLCSVMQCVKLSFMIKNVEKWREVMVLNFLNLVVKRYRKRFSKMRGNPVSRFLCLWFTMSCAITLFALQITHFLANVVVSLPFVCTANFHWITLKEG